jgi:uncharacterized protein YpuA (DUF1002 family)
MKKIFKEDIEAVQTALKAKDLRKEAKEGLERLLESFEKNSSETTKEAEPKKSNDNLKDILSSVENLLKLDKTDKELKAIKKSLLNLLNLEKTASELKKK